MGLFSFFKSSTPQEVVTTERPDIAESDFIDVADPNEEVETKRTIDCSTGYPIDAIYAYISKDFEEEGRQDAAINSDIACRDKKVELIEQELIRLFDVITLKYNDEIRKIESHKKALMELGLLSSIDNCDAVIATCTEHVNKIESMRQSFAKKDESLMSMVNSYKRGFAIGVAEKTQEQINRTNK